MVEFRWIQMSSFLTLLLCVTAGTRQQQRNIVVRNGRQEILSCGNTPDYQEKCDSTEWTFRASRNSSVVLIKHRQTGGRAIKASARTVTEDCSLVIPQVQAKDAGWYTCKRPGRDPVQVHVSVVTIREERQGDEMSLTCHVSTSSSCPTVTWLHNGNSLHYQSSVLRTLHSDCSETLTLSSLFPAYYYLQTSRPISFTCQVADGQNVANFPLDPPPLDVREGDNGVNTTRNTTETAEGASTERKGWPPLDKIMLVLRVVELLLINVIIVLLFRAQGRRDNTHGGEGLERYENLRGASAAARQR